MAGGTSIRQASCLPAETGWQPVIRPILLKLNQPAPGRGRDRLRAANHIHFGEDAFDVRFYSAFANKER